MKTEIKSSAAPQPAGTYSQAIQVDKTVYLAGQIGIELNTAELVSSDFKAQTEQIFRNLASVCAAAGGDLNHIVKLTAFIMDFNHFPILNEMMAHYFKKPYPARTTIQVAALPKNALIEIDAIMVI